MKKELFNELLKSVREARAVMRGEKPPSRIFVYDEPYAQRVEAFLKMSDVRAAETISAVDSAEDIRQLRDERLLLLK